MAQVQVGHKFSFIKGQETLICFSLCFTFLLFLLLSFASFSWICMCNLLPSVSTFSSWLHRAYTHCYSCLLVSPHGRESEFRNPASFCCWNPEFRGRDLDSRGWDLESRTFMDSPTRGDSFRLRQLVPFGVVGLQNFSVLLLVWAWTISAIRISKQVGGLVFMPFPHYATWLLMSYENVKCIPIQAVRQLMTF